MSYFDLRIYVSYLKVFNLFVGDDYSEKQVFQRQVQLLIVGADNITGKKVKTYILHAM